MKVAKQKRTSLLLICMFIIFSFVSGYRSYILGICLIVIFEMKYFDRLKELKSVLVLPYFIFVLYGVVVTMLVPKIYDITMVDYIKNFTGLSNLLVFLILGKLLSLEYRSSVFFKSLIYFGVLYCLYSILNLIINFGSISNFNAIRDINNGTPIFLSFIFIVVLYDKYLFNILSNTQSKLVLVVMLVVLLMSLSRTTYVCIIALILMFLFFSRNFTIFWKSIKYLLFGLLVVFVFIGIIPENIKVTLLKKITNSLAESSSNNDWNSILNVNTDWRGFEKYSTVQQFNTSPFINKIFGNGIAVGIYVGNYALLVGVSTVYIPYLHNSFYTILSKLGVLGLIMFISYFSVNFIVLIFKSRQNILYLLPAGLLVLLTISSYTVQGVVVTGHDGIIITILGYLSERIHYTDIK